MQPHGALQFKARFGAVRKQREELQLYGAQRRLGCPEPKANLQYVRGFLAGVIRKKLGLNLISEKTEKGRVYRIKDGKASPVAADRAKQAA